MKGSMNTDILTLDDLYTGLFTVLCGYDREGNKSYITIVSIRKTAGVGNIDKLTVPIAAGHRRWREDSNIEPYIEP